MPDATPDVEHGTKRSTRNFGQNHGQKVVIPPKVPGVPEVLGRVGGKPFIRIGHDAPALPVVLYPEPGTRQLQSARMLTSFDHLTVAVSNPSRRRVRAPARQPAALAGSTCGSRDGSCAVRFVQFPRRARRTARRR
jgi:hypothetical protein